RVAELGVPATTGPAPSPTTPRARPPSRPSEPEPTRGGPHRARYRQHLLLAAGQMVAAPCAPLAQPGKQRVDRREIPAPRPRGNQQIFFDVERGKNLPLLRDPAEPV